MASKKIAAKKKTTTKKKTTKKTKEKIDYSKVKETNEYDGSKLNLFRNMAKDLGVTVKTRGPQGPKSGYKKEYCQVVIDIMKKGEAISSVCAALGRDRYTVLTWAKIYPEFGEALHLGKELCQAWWEKLNMLVATGKYKTYVDEYGNKPYEHANPNQIAFILSRRFKDYKASENTIEVIGDLSSDAPAHAGQLAEVITIDVKKLDTNHLEALEIALCN